MKLLVLIILSLIVISVLYVMVIDAQASDPCDSELCIYLPIMYDCDLLHWAHECSFTCRDYDIFDDVPPVCKD